MAISEAVLSPPGSIRNGDFPIPGSTRRNSSSSYSSENYKQLPPGRWMLNVHGNRSRCHHHHSSARVRVNISTDRSITTHNRCQRCRAKWITFGGCNTTQLSLLSVNSNLPNPVADEVRYSLISMVRTSTPLFTLSPVLAGNVESPVLPSPSRHNTIHDAWIDEASVGTPRCPAQPEDTNSPLLYSGTIAPPPSVRPATTQKYSLSTGRRISNWKESIHLRFPALHRANLSLGLDLIKQSRMSAKRRGKLPVRSQAVVEPDRGWSAVPNFNMQERVRHEPHLEGQRNEVPELDSPSTSEDAAALFLANLASDQTHFGTMTQEEKATWVRARYTDFINTPTNAKDNQHLPPTATYVTADVIPPSVRNENIISSRTPPLDLLGLGSHRGDFDGYYPVRELNISEGTSEAGMDIDMDNTDLPPLEPRHPLAEQLRIERSGSPRPSSVSSHTVQQQQQRNWTGVRFSMDSTLTSGTVRSTSRPRSSAASRFSQAPTLWTLRSNGTVANNSQISLASH